MSEPATGIYYILNERNHRIYIGKSTDIEHRFREHRRALRYGYHTNKALREDWDIYGSGAFTFAPLVTGYEQQTNLPLELASLTAAEYHWIKFYHSDDPAYGYNYDYAKTRKPTKKKPDMRRRVNNDRRGKKAR